MTDYTMDYCFGDLQAIVTFSNEGAQMPYSDDPLSGGLCIESVTVGGIDILPALTVLQLDEIAFYATDYLMAA